jgi:hypothetical protein
MVATDVDAVDPAATRSYLPQITSDRETFRSTKTSDRGLTIPGSEVQSGDRPPAEPPDLHDVTTQEGALQTWKQEGALQPRKQEGATEKQEGAFCLTTNSTSLNSLTESASIIYFTRSHTELLYLYKFPRKHAAGSRSRTSSISWDSRLWSLRLNVTLPSLFDTHCTRARDKTLLPTDGEHHLHRYNNEEDYDRYIQRRKRLGNIHTATTENVLDDTYAPPYAVKVIIYFFIELGFIIQQTIDAKKNISDILDKDLFSSSLFEYVAHPCLRFKLKTMCQ